MPVPTVLENRQKRSFLRIAPPREFFPGSALWYDDSMPTSTQIDEISSWPRPKLLYIPDRMEQFHLLDLSAGGARISIPSQIARNLNLNFNAADRLILMLDLFAPEQNKRLRYWVQCRVQNVWREHATNNVHMGLQFVVWARPKENVEYGESVGGIEWLRLSSASEVEPIGNWIMRRHLELFREHPMEF